VGGRLKRFEHRDLKAIKGRRGIKLTSVQFLASTEQQLQKEKVKNVCFLIAF